MLPPAITIVTAAIINTIPKPSFTDNLSPNTIIPKKRAVSGSSAPRIAVGVEPIYCIALVVHKKEMAVGNIASDKIFPHRYHLVGKAISPAKRSRTANTTMPKSRR